MVGTSTHDDLEASKGAKKKWTPLEDEALVSCMVDLFNSGTHNGESGFKSGYLRELEKLLKRKMPNAGIKARPHIESRLKTLKKEWGIVFDIVYGPHSSGFRWDYKRHMTHKDATPYRFRSFPHFEELTLMYSREPAIENVPANQANEDQDSTGVASSPGDLQGSKGNKRKWNPREDEALVSCMVELYKFCNPNGDCGFKSGYLRELEKMLNKKLPNCGLKGRPHIESRIKTLKKDWSILYEMIYGPHGNAFKWDSSRKIAAAEVSVWDTYLLSHKEAAAFRFKAFPHFEDLTLIYAKDRATGRHARAVKDILQEMDLGSARGENGKGNGPVNEIYEDGDLRDVTLDADAISRHEPAHEEEDFHDPVPCGNNLCGPKPINEFNRGEDPQNVLPNGDCITRPLVSTEGESTSSARKRKRTEQEENPVCEAGKSLTSSLLNEVRELRKEMGRYLGSDSMRQHITEFNDAMELVEGLTVDERLLASYKIVERPAQMFLFLSLKPELRLRWIRIFLANN
ncbi:hypothetical protein CDL15_Pgr009331 [Punica granatum]|uniref:Myb/SANT-like domain-containing protein n=1 Tax=Punica granatum TaxID=22663 RepID=A0A218XGN6_PUNGR|nr:hypothetical protein CDL15_Pgr009331 [Punica granatum]